MSTNRFFKPRILSTLAIGTFIAIFPLLFSCSKGGTDLGNKAPSIFMTSISGNTVKAGSKQAIALNFNFSDGNGDLGNSVGSGKYDIYTKDSRNDSFSNYYFPKALTSVIVPNQAVSGQCTLNLEAAFMLLRDTRLTGDTLRYEVYIKDRAGNESNHFTTPDIYLTP